jgi:hypothetical protein
VKQKMGPIYRPHFFEHPGSVAVAVVRAAVPVIAHPIAISIPVRAIRYTVTVTIALMHAGPPVWFLVNTTGDKATDDDERYGKFFHTHS